MMNSHSPTSLMVALPFARRFARAMVGSQQEGDALVARSLRQGLALGLPVHLPVLPTSPPIPHHRHSAPASARPPC